MASWFPDYSHLDAIRRRLWSVREFGRAAVMVGAGFSRQAIPGSPSVRQLPLWGEIGQALAAALYGAVGPTFAEAMSGPRLGAEYERTFSRQALESLILGLIPDGSYMPGHHHTLLLSLPWADVFTTNYDTLLERTLPSVHGRKYEVVTNADDLTERARPRIVKLHGSFPSQRPFIITEDDYRLYPSRFAPLVNTVQQSLMENVFCLLGFSGEDPNFLYWSGWVRDNLGESTPTIYLCGLLDLPAPRRRLLEHRRIVPIDLSPLFPHAEFPASQERNAAALEWFLLSLHAGEPLNLLDWPRIRQPGRWSPTRKLPEIPTPEVPPTDPEYSAPGKLPATDLREVALAWGEVRERYAGWEVAPAANRSSLWLNTEHYIGPILEGLAGLALVDALRLAFELVWRLETALVPLFIDWIEKVTPVLEAINPDPERIPLPSAVLRSDDNSSPAVDWTMVRRMWVEVAFALAKEARDDQDVDRFTLWMERLREVVKLRKDWHAHWVQEQCLYALGRLDFAAVRVHLGAWPTDTVSAFWETKRAAILAEIGELPDAAAAAEAALTAIRRHQQSVPGDIGLLSQEGWTMLLLRQVTFDISFGERRDDPAGDRWDQLGAYRCSPWPEIELQSGEVRRRREVEQRRTTKRLFDPGAWTTSIVFSSREDWEAVLAAFAFLRMLEHGALPIRCGRTLMFPESVTAAADAIASAAPLLSLSTKLRVGSSREIERTFDRSAIALLKDDQITFLFGLTTTAIRQALQRMEAGEEAGPLRNTSLVTACTEVLSRLAVCLSDERVEELLQLATTLYRHPRLRGIGFHHMLSNLFRRVIFALPERRIGLKAHELAELPIPGVGGFEVAHAAGWAEPFAVGGWPSRPVEVDGDRQRWAFTVSWLTSVAATAPAVPRGRALVRLERLYRLGVLTEREAQKFGEALWGRVKDGIPSDTLFRPSVYVGLPSPADQDPLSLLRSYLLKHEFRRLVGSPPHVFSFPASEDTYLTTLVDVTRTPWRVNEPGRFIGWSRAETYSLFEKWIRWWEVHRPALMSSHMADVRDMVREEVRKMLDVLRYVVFPRMRDATSGEKQNALTVLGDIEAAGASTSPAISAAMYLGMSPLAAAERLRGGLLSSSGAVVREALSGLQYWVWNVSAGELAAPPSWLVDDLVYIVALRRSLGLASALTVLADVVRRVPELLTREHWEAISIALMALEGETSFRTNDARAALGESASIEFEERPECRCAAASLAHAISRMGQGPNYEPLQEIVERWREAVAVDRLPEVRKAWFN